MSWHFAGEYKRRVGLTWGAFVIVGIFELLFVPFIFSHIINVITNQGITNNNFGYLVIMLSLIFAESFIFWSIHGPARVQERKNAFMIGYNHRRYLLNGMLMLKLKWHAEHHSGETIDKVESSTREITEFSENAFEFIYLIVRFIGAFIILAFYFWQASLILLITTTLIGLFVIKVDKKMMPQFREINLDKNKAVAATFDGISNIKTVITLRIEKRIFDRVMRAMMKPFAVYCKNVTLNEWKWFGVNVLCMFTKTAIMAGYFYVNIDKVDANLLGNIFLLWNYLGTFEKLFERFTSMYSGIVKKSSAIMNAAEMAEAFSDDTLANHVLPADWKKLHIKNLNFSHHGISAEGEGEVDLHLENVSLEIGRGEKIALIGPSGCGKTTLLSLVRALYEPQSVELSVDGKVISEGFSGIAQAIMLAPQDAELFASTIGNNITLGVECPAELVDTCMRVARFKEVVDKLPRGLESQIQERGVNLSGGQKQRLALSRALLAASDPKKSILLFDEPTSSLDPTTEDDVYRGIFTEFNDRTIISSVHRMHLLSRFDRVVMFEDGKVIASGTFNELKESCPQFKAMWDKYNQSSNSNTVFEN